MVELHKLSISGPAGMLKRVTHVPEAEHFFHRRLDQLKEIVRHYFTGHAL